MSTTGNESSGRHRENAPGGRPAPLFDPASQTGHDAPGIASDESASHDAAHRAGEAARDAADRASGMARNAAGRLSSVTSSFTNRQPKAVVPVESDGASVGELVKDASTQISTLVRSEIELAKTELTATVKKGLVGGALFIVAAVLLLYSLTFGLVAAAEGIHAAGFPRWASYLIIWGALVLVAVLASLLGLYLVKRVQKPERTLNSVKETAAWAKSRSKSD